MRVAPSQGYDEDYVAQDFFSDEVGRVLAFDGSRVLDSANNCLHEVTERLPKRQVATHALIALVNPLSRSYKRLAVGAELNLLFHHDGSVDRLATLDTGGDRGAEHHEALLLATAGLVALGRHPREIGRAITAAIR